MSMTITTHYPDDKALIDSLCPNERARFETWFAELNRVNAARSGEMRYSGSPLEEATGVKCWFDFFVDGYTPEEALDEDAASA